MTVPSFDISQEDLDRIKQELGFLPKEELETIKEEISSEAEPTVEAPTPVIPMRRRRGRPRKEETVSPLTPQPLSRRDEKDVARRLQQILLGATGIGGVFKPYIPMTEEEARNIAEPLASFLIRNEPTSALAKEIVENYDLGAVVIGTVAYTARVWNDRRQELERTRTHNRRSALDRVSELQAANNEGRQDEGNRPIIDPSLISRSGTNPIGSI